jgi:hypothetical protein
VVDDPLPAELAATVVRVDELVGYFLEHPDPLVRGNAEELLQRVDGLHRAGLRRLTDLLRAAGLERRALDEAEVRLLYTLYDLGDEAAPGALPPAPPPRGSFVPLSTLLGESESHG